MFIDFEYSGCWCLEKGMGIQPLAGLLARFIDSKVLELNSATPIKVNMLELRDQPTQPWNYVPWSQHIDESNNYNN